MKVAVLGATGLIGSALIPELLESGHLPIIITRKVAAVPDSLKEYPLLEWNPDALEIDPDLFKEAQAVVNLAGANISQGRWTQARKQTIVDSRVNTNRRIVEALSKLKQRPKVLISASAVGFYGSAGDNLLTEDSPAGSDFLASVCSRLEKEVLRAQASGIRTVALRTGVVLSAKGGALKKMVPVFKLGMGGPIASGKHWFPWIHEQDMARIIVHCLENKQVHGPLNAAASQTITNRQFTKILAKALKRPAFFPVPYLALRILFGELAAALVASQKISVEKIEQSGFKFLYPELEAALENLL